MINKGQAAWFGLAWHGYQLCVRSCLNRNPTVKEHHLKQFARTFA